MAGLIEFQKRVAKINITTMFDQIIKEQEQEILQLNKDQLLEGKNIKNQKIKPKYKSQAYAKRKARQNSKPGNGTPDLYLSGGLHNSEYLKKKGSAFVPEFNTPYSKFVLARYDDVAGWNNEAEKQRNEIISKELIQDIRTTLKI